MGISRRNFLKAAGVAGAAGAAGLLGARIALGWGEITNPAVLGPLPAGGFKVLEVFLYGGVSPWETFYVRSGISDPFFGMRPQVIDLDWAACGGVPVPSDEVQPFGSDPVGAVAWGPSTKPLWRSDIFSRARMIVQRHNLEPHEAAIPYSLTGHVLGRPNFSGLGAAISHRFANITHPLPYSYVLMPDGGTSLGDNFQGMVSTGTHGGEHRPLLLMVGPSSDELGTQLQRDGMTTQADNLLRFYRASYADRLRTNGAVARSKGFSAYSAGVDNLLAAPSLAALLSGISLAPSDVTGCASFLPPLPPTALDRTSASVRAAAFLLSQPESLGGARYVGVIDGGLLHPGGAGYDTHGDNTMATAINLFNVLSALAGIIDPSSTPAPGKISLSDTLVVIKTEFGRTPTPSGSGESAGRDHWPHGYVNILLGGPVTSRAIAGGIGSDGDTRGHALPATETEFGHFTASEFQAAVMLAAGIFPFQGEVFGIGDMSLATRGTTEEETASRIRSRVLGV
ncbi:MAG TPA: DUF1501 domain-containing protein [Pyrinomonadaceae bacterium]